MNDTSRRSDLFRRMRRQRSSPMRSSIDVVALPRLDEKSLSRTGRIRNACQVSLEKDFDPTISTCSGRVSMSNSG
jgi:hypothetical protein